MQKVLIVDFEDTKLPDHPSIRLAFEKAAFAEAMEATFNPQFEDTGTGPGSMKLMTRAGEILHEAVPSADPEQIAAAVLFLSVGFQEPSLMQRSVGDELPKACAWSQEWRDVARRVDQGAASLELRQILTAANIALMEGIKYNLPAMDRQKVLDDLMEIDFAAREMGDLQAPALEAKFKQARTEAEQVLGGMSPENIDQAKAHAVAKKNQQALQANAKKLKPLRPQ